MTIVLDTTLDVSAKYAELIDRVTDGDSVYVRTKEALLAIFDDRLQIVGSNRDKELRKINGNSNNINNNRFRRSKQTT